MKTLWLSPFAWAFILCLNCSVGIAQSAQSQATNAVPLQAVPLQQLQSSTPDKVDWANVVVAITGVINLLVVIWIFYKQKVWEEQKSSEEDRQKNLQLLREAKAFWLEEIVLRNALPTIHSILGDYRAKIHDHLATTPDNKTLDIRRWRDEIDKIRISVIEPGLHVDLEGFTAIDKLIEELDDLVVGELSLDSAVPRDPKSASRALARFDSYRNELYKSLFQSHLGVFK